MKILVLAGGTSTEREISIISGTEVAKALQSKGHDVFLTDVFFGCADEDAKTAFVKKCDISAVNAKMNSDSRLLGSELKNRREFIGPNVIKLAQEADGVFMALHGENGEDGRLQAAFDLFGVRYSGTGYLSSAIAMDKELAKKFFRWNNIPTPDSMLIKKSDFEEKGVSCVLRFPVIVKPCCGGSSVGITVAENSEAFGASLKKAFEYEDRIIVEEFIKGREFSVAVVGGKAYPVMEISPIEGFYDYRNKYSPGSTIETCPAKISPEKTDELQKLAERGALSLGITGYCRLDFMMDAEENLYCLEANTLPGMTPTSLIPQEAAVLGISFPDLCEILLGL